MSPFVGNGEEGPLLSLPGQAALFDPPLCPSVAAHLAGSTQVEFGCDAVVGTLEMAQAVCLCPRSQVGGLSKAGGQVCKTSATPTPAGHCQLGWISWVSLPSLRMVGPSRASFYGIRKDEPPSCPCPGVPLHSCLHQHLLAPSVSCCQ